MHTLSGYLVLLSRVGQRSARGLLSKARQVLTSDRCGDQCQMQNMPKGPQGKWWQGYWKLHSGTCHQPALHPFHHEAFCTSWLLPETIRSPLVPSVLLPGMSSPSPNTTAALGQRKVINQNFIPFSFARSSLLSQIWISHQIWSRTTHFQGDTVHILTI